MGARDHCSCHVGRVRVFYNSSLGSACCPRGGPWVLGLTSYPVPVLLATTDCGSLARRVPHQVQGSLAARPVFVGAFPLSDIRSRRTEQRGLAYMCMNSVLAPLCTGTEHLAASSGALYIVECPHTPCSWVRSYNQESTTSSVHSSGRCPTSRDGLSSEA